MNFSAHAIASIIQGTIEGNPNITIHTVAPIDKGTPGALSFIYDPKYIPFIYNTQCSIVIVSEDLKLNASVTPTLIRVKNPYAAFNQLLTLYSASQLKTPEIETPNYIHPTAKLGKDVYIGAFVYISAGASIDDGVKIYPNTFIGENVKIGEKSIIHANVSVYRECIIGKNCTIHSGTVIGSDGFGFLEDEEGKFVKIPQIGNVILEDWVEIGANTVIDRSTLGSTIIRTGAKLDNLIQIAHNVEIGSNTGVAAQTGISGGTKVGSKCKIGGQVGIVGHIQIADETNIGAQSGVSKSTQPKTTLRGSPAQNIKEQLKQESALRQLPDLLNRVLELEKQIEQLIKLQ